MNTLEETARGRRRWRTAVFIAGCVAFGAAAVPSVSYGLSLLNVFVTNTPANPVPTKPVGTTPVSGSVTAVQEGEPVTIGRTWRRDSRFDSSTTLPMYIVPAGKRLVVDAISVRAEIIDGGSYQTALVGPATTDIFVFSVPVTAPLFGATPDNSGHRHGLLSGAAEPHAVFEAGATIVFEIQRNDANVVPASGDDPVETQDSFTVVGRLLPAS